MVQGAMSKQTSKVILIKKINVPTERI